MVVGDMSEVWVGARMCGWRCGPEQCPLET